MPVRGSPAFLDVVRSDKALLERGRCPVCDWNTTRSASKNLKLTLHNHIMHSKEEYHVIWRFRYGESHFSVRPRTAPLSKADVERIIMKEWGYPMLSAIRGVAI